MLNNMVILSLFYLEENLIILIVKQNDHNFLIYNSNNLIIFQNKNKRANIYIILQVKINFQYKFPLKKLIIQ